jgi:hypothetical protein
MTITRKLALALLFAGSVGCSGGGAQVHQYVSTVSQGQELEDLKLALDQGAVTKSEYDRLQQKILSRKY